MNPIQKLTTGIPGLDVITHGGLPVQRSTLLVGRSGSGKTIAGLQIAAHLAESGVSTVVLAIEETPADLVQTGDALDLDLTGKIAAKKLRIVDASLPDDGPVVVSGEYDISGLLHRIQAITKESGAKALILDSATALFSPRPSPELLRRLFFQLVHALKRLELTSVILAEAPGDYGVATTTLGVEDFVCDVVCILRNLIDGERRRRTIEIQKYRRSAHYKGEYPCTITNRGLTVFPLDAKERPEDMTMERYSAGFPSLDTMIGGGFLRDSISIVRGPTGSGKTLLSGLYARAGATRQERVVYYGFEEPRPILLRNFRQMGMGMEELIDAGHLKVTCRYPEAISLEDLLVDLRLGLEAYQPSLVVLDSISSLEHASSEKGFRQFMVGLAAILRQHGRSALLTQTIAGGDALHSAPYLSTIADTILSLDYSIASYELDRTLRVIKMRGSAHETHPFRLEIKQGGLSAHPVPRPTDPR